jgi:putative ABC transport system permease protein
LGGVLGIGFAVAMTKTILIIAPASVPRLASVRMDSHIIEFTLAVSILVGVLSGLSPAIVLSGSNVTPHLKAGGSALSHAEGGRLRNVLVVSEVALAIVLVVGAGLMAQSLYRLEQVRRDSALRIS